MTKEEIKRRIELKKQLIGLIFDEIEELFKLLGKIKRGDNEQ